MLKINLLKISTKPKSTEIFKSKENELNVRKFSNLASGETYEVVLSSKTPRQSLAKTATSFLTIGKYF